MVTTTRATTHDTAEPTIWHRARSWCGRSGRLKYAVVLLASVIATIVGVVLLLSPALEPIGTPAAFAWVAVCAYFWMCSIGRRIHDLDWPVLAVAVAGCVPGLGIVVGLALLLMPGHSSATANGPVPILRWR